jgi:hypothetical protein
MKADDAYDWVMENIFGWVAVGALFVLMFALFGCVGLLSYMVFVELQG